MSIQPNIPCPNPELERSLTGINVISFVIVELTEYLDTHPEDRDALNYFNYYNRALNKMKAEFAVKFYPLTVAAADGYCNEWSWGLAPLPWEGV